MYTKPKKSLGQNFLVDKNIQRKIIEACELKPSDLVLEIGAGRGELTRFIADRVNEVYALEIDLTLCRALKDKFSDFTNIKIINQNILKFNLRKYFSRHKNKIKVIGNIPYYITTPIIERLFQYRDRISSVYLAVQKEFAQRIVAAAGSKDYGSFSCFIRYYTQPKIIFFIKKTCFYPRPKVDSCFLRLRLKRQSLVFKLRSESLFFRIIRAAFNKRRKTLRNSLRGVIAQEKLGKFFVKYNLDINIRPEDLNLEDFANLTNI